MYAIPRVSPTMSRPPAKSRLTCLLNFHTPPTLNATSEPSPRSFGELPNSSAASARVLRQHKHNRAFRQRFATKSRHCRKASISPNFSAPTAATQTQADLRPDRVRDRPSAATIAGKCQVEIATARCSKNATSRQAVDRPHRLPRPHRRRL